MPLTKTLEAKIRYQYATFITLETYSDRRMHSLLDLPMTERTHSSCQMRTIKEEHDKNHD